MLFNVVFMLLLAITIMDMTTIMIVLIATFCIIPYSASTTNCIVIIVVITFSLF